MIKPLFCVVRNRGHKDDVAEWNVNREPVRGFMKIEGKWEQGWSERTKYAKNCVGVCCVKCRDFIFYLATTVGVKPQLTLCHSAYRITFADLGERSSKARLK